MAEQDSASDPRPGSGPGHGSAPEQGGAELLAFQQAAVLGQAVRIRETGEAGATRSAELVGALEEASAAASGMAAAVPGGVLCGTALAECAALLARRARDSAEESERIARAMTRGVGLLAEADEEVANRVSRAAG
ncbi:hypothetical protein K3888_02130 [Dietzia aurantiaca]|uniref:hypothetical protein n=1 Tax=Dietzia aurantiaca TaxID=983873 RepID=UPI001E60F454|nr:hypothetical protein [Dietzia aurantiaca]MCD2261490.1 hypothetical protein [Dietzia aurantiaca]